MNCLSCPSCSVSAEPLNVKAAVGVCDHVVCETHAKNSVCPVCGVSARWRPLDLSKSRRAALLGRNFQQILLAARKALNFWAVNADVHAALVMRDASKSNRDLEISNSAMTVQLNDTKARLERLERENEILKNENRQAQRELLKLEGNLKISGKRARTTTVPDSTPFLATTKPTMTPYPAAAVTPFASNWSGNAFSSDISKRLFRQR